MMPRVAVVGGGWAGCAAALTLAQAGVPATLYEAGPRLGGRARAVSLDGRELDNGQHILLGAYTQTLELLSRLHGGETGILWRLPLTIEQPGEFRLACPRWPAPLNLMGGLLGAHGLSWQEKWRAARWASAQIGAGIDAQADTTVAAMLKDQPDRLRRLLWEPLCLSALNTPLNSASARTFRRVLAAAFGQRRADSDLLLPRVDLGTLLPDAAASQIIRSGGQIRRQTRVHDIAETSGAFQLATRRDAAVFDRLILAVAPQHLGTLAQPLPGLEDPLSMVSAFRYEPIATAYLQYRPEIRLSRPMLSLSGLPGQFVFDRGQTHGNDGLLAVVVSAASTLLGQQQGEWLSKVEAQLAEAFSLPPSAWRRGVVEKQATYACVPQLSRPPVVTPNRRVFLAGDYTAGPYPATLESATRSGVQSALALLQGL